MSASLVGSEMCIRDRGELGRQPPKESLGQTPVTLTRGCSDPVGSPTHDPVSYTHLTLPTICSV
eukprot:4087707-Alexandrium_andersonii.AAC.1